MEATRSRGSSVILHGPYFDRIQEVITALRSAHPPASRYVGNAQELADAVCLLLSDRSLRQESAKSAERVSKRIGEGILDLSWSALEPGLRLPGQG